MTPRRRAAHRAALRRARAALLSDGPARIEPNRRDPSTTGVADEDAQALSEMLQVLASQRNKGKAEQLARIDRALERLEAAPEDFGLCEECEEPIAPKRLAAMPWATLCLPCQARREPRRGGGRRKVTDFE